MTEQPWRRWRTPEVRDLCWAIASPPLLPETVAPAGVRWLTSGDSARHFTASADWLAALDRDPAPLLAHLAHEHDHRLGSHFESLLAFWLAWPDNPCHRLLARNVAIRRDGRTLGELDFLVEDRRHGGIEHWEVAVKFYLGTGDGRSHRNWIGPGLRDRLDLKLARLIDHQLPLAGLPEAAATLRPLLPAGAGTTDLRPVCLLAGSLFHPAAMPGGHPGDSAGADPALAAPNHLRGWWQHRRDFLEHPDWQALHWLRLPKANWLTPVHPTQLGDLPPPRPPAGLADDLPIAGPRSAVAVIGLRDGQEVTRGFVVGDDWPSSPVPR